MCNVCDFERAQKYNLKQHIESVHEGLKPFKCSIFNYETAYKSDLKKHIVESSHCPICDNSNFEEKMRLQMHLIKTHGKKVPLDSL